MRVACLNQDPGVSPRSSKGAAVHLRAMRWALRALGAEVVAVDADDPRRARERLEAAHAAEPLSLIYERYALGRSAGAEMAAERRIPYVLEVNAPLAEEQHDRRGRQESVEDRERDHVLFGQATAVIAVSRTVASYAVHRGARSEVVHVFPNGVDARRFRPRRERDGLRQRLVPAGRFVVGFHGRLRPWHGFERVAEACARLLGRGAPLHLVAVGEGDFAATLDGRIPAERRSLVGWRPHSEVARYVAAFDALPLGYGAAEPYFSPLKLAEAMACGVVPVVPAVGDLPDLVAGAGLVYPPEDVDALEQALARLIEHPGERARLGRAGVQRAAALSWERIATFALGFAGRLVDEHA